MPRGQVTSYFWKPGHPPAPQNEGSRSEPSAGSWSCSFTSHVRQGVDHPVRLSQVSHPSLRPPSLSALKSLSLFLSLLRVKCGSKQWENAPFFSRDWMETWGCFCLNLTLFQTGGLRLSLPHPYPTLSCSSLGLCQIAGLLSLLSST